MLFSVSDHQIHEQELQNQNMRWFPSMQTRAIPTLQHRARRSVGHLSHTYQLSLAPEWRPAYDQSIIHTQHHQINNDNPTHSRASIQLPSPLKRNQAGWHPSQKLKPKLRAWTTDLTRQHWTIYTARISPITSFASLGMFTGAVGQVGVTYQSK